MSTSGPLATTFVLATILLSPVVAQSDKGYEKGKGKGADLRATAAEAIQSGNFVKAEEAAAKALELDKNDPVAWYQIGYARHALKKYDLALEAHMKAASLDNPRMKVVGTYNAACVYAIRNEKERAFEWLHKAVELGFDNLGTLRSDTDMDNLRGDPRFGKIVAAVEANAEASPARAFTMKATRQNTRVAYFNNQGSTGQFAIDYGPVPWQDKYDKVLDSEESVGRRWRLGSNFWTNLDTNIPLKIGGEVFEPGVYYLMITNKGNRELALTVMPAELARKQRLDASAAGTTTGGVDVPMKLGKAEEIAGNLAIEAKMSEEDNTSGELVIRFGPHVLTVPVHTRVKSWGKKKQRGGY